MREAGESEAIYEWRHDLKKTSVALLITGGVLLLFGAAAGMVFYVKVYRPVGSPLMAIAGGKSRSGGQVAAAMRYESKQALIDDIRTAHDSLCARLHETPKTRWHERGVWGDGWTLSDLVAHLAEWQRMFLSWYEEGKEGATPKMPAPGYKWSQTPKLNRAIWQKHRSRSTAAIKADFDSGYVRILQLVKALSPEQLLVPGHFTWTGKHPLTTYLGPNTASHYRFAIKVINRWLKRVPAANTSAARPNRRSQPTKGRPGTPPENAR